MAGNNYFHFKQFTIEQRYASMKVGTDGVLLGAWASHSNPARILDIGTGTGLVALMLAQRFYHATLTAIEIDADACRDAKNNFHSSKWAERIELCHMPLQEFVGKVEQPFDLVVCNPPFFRNSFKSNHKGRNTARHTDDLPFEVLIQLTSTILSEVSCFSVIIPFEEERKFRDYAANYRLFAHRILRIFPNPAKSAKRVLIEFRKEAMLTEEMDLIIESMVHHDYTQPYIDLVKDFYLNL